MPHLFINLISQAIKQERNEHQKQMVELKRQHELNIDEFRRSMKQKEELWVVQSGIEERKRKVNLCNMNYFQDFTGRR